MPATDSDQEKIPFRGAAITSYRDGWTELPKGITYLAWGDEICPRTQRLHKQAFAYAKVAMRLTGWKKLFPGDHIEAMLGNFAQNEKYCSKQSELHELGVRPMQNGRKRSLETLCSLVVEAGEQAKPLCDIVTEPEHQQTYVMYNNGIEKLYRHAITKKLRQIDRDFAPEVVYIYGPPGLGKTRYVHDLEPEVYNIPSYDQYKWKDGYRGQAAVLYDNVTPTNINAVQMLREIDRYFVEVSVKGGLIGWRPERIYITSVYDINLFASTAKFSLPAEFTRRVTRVIDYTAAAAAAAGAAAAAASAVTDPLPGSI